MARATAKYIRMSPRKVRRVVNEIRGKDVNSAKTLLKFLPYAAATVVGEVLKSAVANAKENENLIPEELKVSKAYVDEAPVFKRWRAMSRGRGYQILKRNSHITIEVEGASDEMKRSSGLSKAAGAVKETLKKQEEETKKEDVQEAREEKKAKEPNAHKTKKVKSEKKHTDKKDSKSKGKKGKEKE